MFKKLSLLVILVVAVFTQESVKPSVKTLSEKSFVDPNGYHFEFMTSDGTSRKEEAQLITVGDHQGIGVKGSYSYIGSDGQEYLVTFTADENGYRPEIKTVTPADNQ